MYTPAVIKMEGGTDHDLLSLETTSTKGEEDKNEEGNKEEGKLAEGEGGEGTSTSQFPPPPPFSPLLPSSLQGHQSTLTLRK